MKKVGLSKIRRNERITGVGKLTGYYQIIGNNTSWQVLTDSKAVSWIYGSKPQLIDYEENIA